jgi:hypothetical protein
MMIQKPVVMGFHCSVALAGRTLEALEINDFDASPAVMDEASPLKGDRNWRNAAPAYAEHFGEKFLGQREGIAAGQIA